jgi:hypothetical protein
VEIVEVTAEDAAAVRAAEAVAVGVIAVVAVVAMVDIVVDTAVMADTVGAVDAGKNQSPQTHGDRDKNLERAARNRGLC